MNQVVTVSGRTFKADVHYEHPSHGELRQLFPGFVDDRIREKEFSPIDICRNVVRRDRSLTFECVDTDNYMSMRSMLREMERNGLRPALYEEGICFARTFPEEQEPQAIIVLGSVVDIRGELCVASLSCNHVGRGIRLDWSGGEWSRHDRFLAVRE